jgi:hypothetical protein
MTLGGRRLAVSWPRMRTVDDERELAVHTYEYFADRDPSTRAVMDARRRADRKYAVVGQPVGEEGEQAASATGKSTLSERFVERTRTALGELMARRLDDVLSGGDNARRAEDRRPPARRRARDQHGGREDPARAVVGQHRERDAARRPEDARTSALDAR